MYSVTNNPILLPHQVKILKIFFVSDFSRPFFLTGGTALSAFYLAHRESKDLDLFSLEEVNPYRLDAIIQEISKETHSSIVTKVKSETYNEIYLENKAENWLQRIDIVREQPKRFGQLTMVEGVRVDSLDNIGSNKILTVFGRLEPKDYIDLYAIITQTPHTFDELFALARQKDLGLSEFYFADSIANIEKITIWPNLKKSLDFDALVKFYQDLSNDLFLRVKPKK